MPVYDFLLTIIELFSLPLTAEALMQNVSRLAAMRRGRSEPEFQRGRGRPWGIFFGFYKTRLIVTDRRTDRQTDGIAIANTALTMRALRAL